MAMRAWQWCVGVIGLKHFLQSRTRCCRQVGRIGAWVGGGGRKSGGGGDLDFGTGGVVAFAGPYGTGRPLSCTGSTISSDSEC